MIIGLIVFVLLLFGGFAIIVWAGVFKVERDQNKAERNSETILDEAFDGRSDVTFNTNMRTLKFDTVVAGAKVRGYTLVNQAGEPTRAMTLMFEKAQ